MLTPFSPRQLELLTWWTPASPYADYTGIIADGAIRSGKSFVLSTSFVMWAMSSFEGEQFALCGKTIKSLRRNVLSFLVPMLESRGYGVEDSRGENRLTVRRGRVKNTFYLFGGRDEKSADLIQGITLQGALLDEAQLMPESFVNQATGRCSREGSKLWFSCNPESPAHPFKTNWIDAANAKRIAYLHFTMDDNPSLSEHMKQRYRNLYSGVFYRRFVLGLWSAAEGAVYPMFDPQTHVVSETPPLVRTWIGVDYGHTNPTVFCLLGEGTDRSLYVVEEYYHAGNERGAMSPAGYAKAMDAFIDAAAEQYGPAILEGIYVDPSAAGFIAQLREQGYWRVRAADNRVLPGIARIATLLDSGRFKISERCKHTIAEFQSYAWDRAAMAEGRDRPVKKGDHCVDAVRYAVGGGARGLCPLDPRQRA